MSDEYESTEQMIRHAEHHGGECELSFADCSEVIATIDGLRATVAALHGDVIAANNVAELAIKREAELKATVDALKAERYAAYRRGWCDAREAAAMMAAGIWHLKSVDGEDYEHVVTNHIADCIRDLQPTEHDAASAEAWHERA